MRQLAVVGLGLSLFADAAAAQEPNICEQAKAAIPEAIANLETALFSAGIPSSKLSVSVEAYARFDREYQPQNNGPLPIASTFISDKSHWNTISHCHGVVASYEGHEYMFGRISDPYANGLLKPDEVLLGYGSPIFFEGNQLK